MRIRAFVVLTALLLAPAAGANAQETQAPPEPEVGSVDFGGQFSTTDGDEARYQKYKDMRSSALLDAFKYTRGTDDWVLNVTASHVGYRDQRYVVNFRNFQRAKISFSGFWVGASKRFVAGQATRYVPVAGLKAAVG